MGSGHRNDNIRLSRLNECLLSFTPYPMENVRRLTALCGELLSADCAFYSWFDGAALYTPGMWKHEGAGASQIPSYNAIESPEGKIVYDVIRGSEGVLASYDHLADTAYAQSDPVIASGLFHSFLGRRVRCDGTVVGCLSVLFRNPRHLTVDDEEFVHFITSAIAVEERRKRLETERENYLQHLIASKERLENEVRERERAEKELQTYSEKLAQTNEEMKTFAYIVSHDLRAPVTNLRGFISELKMALERSALILSENDPEAAWKAVCDDVDESLGYIESSAGRMDALLTAILKLSRIGRQELVFETIEMDVLLHDILRTFAHQIESKGIDVVIGELPNVVADYTSMNQVLGNLLDNAIKYLDPERTGRIEVSGESDKTRTVYHIRDNGLGVPEKDQARIFEIFQRAGVHPVPGEGMGLAYVRSIVRRHGGEISCASTPGAGSAFSFSIPKHLAKPPLAGEGGSA